MSGTVATHDMRRWIPEVHQPAMSQDRRINSVRDPGGKGHCVLRIPQAAIDEKLGVVTLPALTKIRLFAKAANGSLPQTKKAHEVLKSLTGIDPTLQGALGSKADALRDLHFDCVCRVPLQPQV